VLNVTDELYYLATNDYSASAGTSSFYSGLAAHLGDHGEAQVRTEFPAICSRLIGRRYCRPFLFCGSRLPADSFF
jgi:hypothetical protein